MSTRQRLYQSSEIILLKTTQLLAAPVSVLSLENYAFLLPRFPNSPRLLRDTFYGRSIVVNCKDGPNWADGLRAAKQGQLVWITMIQKNTADGYHCEKRLDL